MITVLSTKVVSNDLKTCLPNSVNYIEYNAISIEQIPFQVNGVIENAIVTSQNAVKQLVQSNVVIKNIFCVGQKTRALLETNDYKVIETLSSALELASVIVDKYSNKAFTFFCGDIRRDELPSVLKSNSIKFNETIIYKTQIKSTQLDCKVDYVLCFSPSGVLSVLKSDINRDLVCVCIGKTTASFASQYFSNVLISNTQDVEGVFSMLKSSLK